MPAEAIFIEEGPEVAEAEGEAGEGHGPESAPHGFAGGVFVREGAEGDAGVAHAGSAVGVGEEQHVVEGGEEGEGEGGGDGHGESRGGDGLFGEKGGGEDEDGGCGEGADDDEGEVEQCGHEPAAEGRGLRDE